jgi:hypothetical protein
MRLKGESHVYHHRFPGDVSTEEVVKALRDGLEADYNVLPEMIMGRAILQTAGYLPGYLAGRLNIWCVHGDRPPLGGLPTRPLTARSPSPVSAPPWAL